MKTSQKGLDFIKSEEGLVNHVYKDQAGFPTVGIGHKLTPLQLASGNLVINGESVRYAGGLTDQQCYDLLAQDVIPAENEVNQAVEVTLNQNQFDALVDFTFNCGVGAFASSSALEAINAGQFDQVPADLAKWNKIHKPDGTLAVCDNLVRRRAKEAALFMEAV